MGWRASCFAWGGCEGRSHANPCKSCSCLFIRPIFRPRHRLAAEPKLQCRCSTRPHRKTLVRREGGPHPPTLVAIMAARGGRTGGPDGPAHHAQVLLRITPSQEGTSQRTGVWREIQVTWVHRVYGAVPLRVLLLDACIPPSSYVFARRTRGTGPHIICDSCYCGIQARINGC